jgi:hypothetical protein
MLILLCLFCVYVMTAMGSIIYALDILSYTDKQAIAFGVLWPVFFCDYLVQGYRQIMDKRKRFRPEENENDCGACEICAKVFGRDNPEIHKDRK